MNDNFSGHEPGDWYCLTREQFVTFAGLAPIYNGFLKELRSGIHHGRNGDWPDPERQAFWAAIASAEAMRKFLPRDEQGYCESTVDLQSKNGCMVWDYTSWSGTRFKAVEERQLYRNQDQDLEPAESIFLVQIPAHRDLPGRNHHDQLRSGRAYNS